AGWVVGSRQIERNVAVEVGNRSAASVREIRQLRIEGPSNRNERVERCERPIAVTEPHATRRHQIRQAVPVEIGNGYPRGSLPVERPLCADEDLLQNAALPVSQELRYPLGARVTDGQIGFAITIEIRRDDGTSPGIPVFEQSRSMPG